MATIYNTQLSKELIEAAKIQISKDTVPNQIADKVVPVMEVNPKLLRRCDIVRDASGSDSASTTIYTTPTNQDFYLSACSIALYQDAGGSATEADIRVTIGGAVRKVIVLVRNAPTNTGGGASLSLSFPIPIKIDRNTTITVNPNGIAAAVRSYATIIGYIDEQSLA